MKLKDLATGKIWKIDSVVANDWNGDLRAFYGDYELIPDEPTTPQQSPHVEDLIASNTRAINHNTASIENLTSFGEDILKRVLALESERTLVTEVIQSHGVELEEGLKMDSDILKRVQALESDNQRLTDRLNAIEGLGIPK